MQPDRPYRLPVSNIAYHIYSPEEDVACTKAVSRQAFKRTMDNYHEHEDLADLFQVELDKRDRLTQERKERERSLKAQKKSVKKPQQSRSQDASQMSAPERHSLRRHLRNSSANGSSNGISEGGKDLAIDNTAVGEKSSGSLKRSRRNSDISTSDISGYGDDDVKFLPPLPRTTHLNSNSSRHRGFGIRSNERSTSSSPALPLTPSPRLTPSDSRNENQTAESERGLSHGSLNQSTADNSSTSSSIAPTHTPALALPGHMTVGRRKRKQAIPVHPSVVDRIPGITLRIQREKLGDQMQVEILKNLEDYGAQRESELSPASKLQATQDLRKVKESIESGRPGYAFFPKSSPISLLRQLETSPGPTSNSGTSSTHGWDRDIDSNQRNVLPWPQSTSSLATLTRASSKTGSVDSLAAMTDLFDARSLPLSWENFSTRECVVNKVVGKHDKDLDMLEEVVQDVIIRQHYTNQQSLHQQSPANQERDSDHGINSIHSQRRPSGIPASLVTPATAAASASTIASMSAASTTSRPLRSTGASSSPTSKSFPTRATRSRKNVSDYNGDHIGNDSELVAHDDIELVLKQRRKRKLEERKRQGSKASSRDGEDEEDIGDEADGDDSEVFPKIEICEEPKHMDVLRSSYILGKDRGLKASSEIYSDGDQVDRDGDVPMVKSNRPPRKRQISSMESDVFSASRRQTETPVIVTTRTRGATGRSRHHHEDYVYGGLTSSSDSESNTGDDDYRDRSYKGSIVPQRKSANIELKTINGPEPKKSPEPVKPQESKKSPESTNEIEQSTDIAIFQSAKNNGSLEKRLSLVPPQHSSRNRLPISVPIVSADGHRRTKKIWSRGRNTRKEDEVVDTTSDDDSSDAGKDGTEEDRKMLLEKHFGSSSPTPTAPEIISDIKNGTSETDLPIAISNNTHHTSSTHSRKVSMSISTHVSGPVSSSAAAMPPITQSITNDANSADSGSKKHYPNTRESGGRTRARARSFSSTINTDDKTKFFENALGAIDQKRRETLAKKRAAREAEERERQEREKQKQREKEERDEKERLEAIVQLQQQEKAPKIESSNLPKSSKSLPGRILRRTKGDASTVEGYVDPDCTSCRLELSIEDKSLWKTAQESGEIQLPKTWGTHAILCRACRLLYNDHHWRCTACFYVPVKEEMTTSSCSRCRAGTWLKEAVRAPSLSEK
ncbi:hypothetical protein BGX27_009826 [Mortierella sp. AM989]|nr:hypothetical protein BGX27_009826 [Mortierella sp. AM989]